MKKNQTSITQNSKRLFSIYKHSETNFNLFSNYMKYDHVKHFFIVTKHNLVCVKLVQRNR